MEPLANKLLVVDDDAALRRSLNATLHQRGFDVDLANEGLPALKLIEESVSHGLPYACVVTDIRLPDINGIKLLEIIKAHYPELPVVVVSAYGSDDTEGTVRIKQGDGYLPKPFLVDDLTATIRGMPAPHIRKVPRPLAEPAPQSVSAYSLVTIDPRSNVEEAFRTLFFMNNVIYCDAVHGNSDVVMLINAPTASGLEAVWRDQVKTVPGVSAATFNPVVKPDLDPAVARFLKEYDKQRAFDPSARKLAFGPNALSTYLLIDVEKGRLPNVYPRICFLDGVTFCDAVVGGYDLIALVQTSSVSENDRILNEELKSIEGIVRTMSLNVINVFEV